ncbi:Hydroxylase cctR-like protein [Cladobotryum mycophilum]|uniref:Hydroxylase cctR-like protein n=1 Tax=Cladobotryum mycophilum TaxID=491253 RepID=A0ABR0SP90_9HYPO
MKERDTDYKPLEVADEGEAETYIDPAEQGLLPPRYSEEATFPKRNITPSSIFHIAIISFELILCAFLVAGFVFLKNARESLTERVPLDGLLDLGSYNTMMKFENNSYLHRDTEEGNTYWKNLLESGGVVSLNTEWAQEQGLRPSAMSPTDSSQSIYQIDVFHALHCLNSIRQNLVPENRPPWDEKHMLHCLDYVRHQLLCHPDLTLVRTRDLDEFVLDETHMCRDYGAVVDWVDRHRWVEFPEWLKNKTSHRKQE